MTAGGLALSSGTAKTKAVTSQDNLLRHANEVRKHGNLDTLDAFLKQSGYSWIEMMVSHAKDSYESYSTSTHHADSTQAQAFEHKMAAELLKTPSPKKKRVRPAIPTFSADPFGDDDKENASLTSPSKLLSTAKIESVKFKGTDGSAPQTSKPTKSTRSKTDKNQIVHLPNPFEKHADQASKEQSAQNIPVLQTDSRPDKSLTKNGETRKTAVADKKTKEVSPPKIFGDDDSREVECSLLAVGETTKPVNRKALTSRGLPADSTFAIPETEDEGTPSPRESTPPPKSPEKSDRREASEWARHKLDESLLKLDFDDDEEEETTTTTPEESDARHVSQNVVEEKTPTPLQLVHATSEDISAGRTTAAPKRTLSSMAHAKKSLANMCDKQQPRSSSMVPSSVAAAKGSFLSKSIMRAEMDQDPTSESHDESQPDIKIVQDIVAIATATPATSMKRKSDEDEQQGRLTKKSQPGDADEIHAVTTGNIFAGQQMSEANEKGSSRAVQSLKEKIASYSATKAPIVTSSTSGPSSLSTHQIGVGAAKIASPIFSRSNSSNTLHGESISPVARKAGGKDLTKDEVSVVSTQQGDLKKESRAKIFTQTSTTPTNSPGPNAYSLYPKTTQQTAPAPTSVNTKGKAARSPLAKQRISHISIDDASETEVAAYDTSSDGDLSLVDLMAAAAAKTTPASAPRPPGATGRIMPAPPKSKSGQKTSSGQLGPSTKQPASTAFVGGKDNNKSPSRPGTASSSASTLSGSSVSSVNHATWGGSISSKLKGILGFSSSMSGTSPANGNTSPMAKSVSSLPRQQQTQHIPMRKDSFVPGASSARAAVGQMSASKTANIIRQKEAEAKAAEMRTKQIEDRARVQAQAQAEAAKKRAREEALAATKPSAAKAGMSKVAQQKHQAAANTLPEAKKRKSNEGVAIPVTQAKSGSTAASATASATSSKVGTGHLIESSAVKGTAGKGGAHTLPKSFAKSMEKPTAGTVFSDHNPFQRAQQQQQQQALAAVAQQLQRHNANPANVVTATSTANMSPNSKLKAASTAHIELEEPDSAYSDSEDEETIRRRLQHKPWETREGLALALEAQSSIDADAIFGIPQGGVPLDDILPPQTENARVRRMRPRSSSATWSRDGLKQFEIDRYNERMGIKGPGVQLIQANVARDDVGRSPGRAGRMSALAQSAIAQGHISSSLHKKTSQAFR